MDKYFYTLPLLLVMPLAWAQQATQPAPLPEPPQLPPQVETGQMPEPEVTIIEQEGRTLQQYSVNGQVYMIKVIPSSGPSYYLLDLDGDGFMDVRRDGPQDIFIPQWVLFRW